VPDAPNTRAAEPVPEAARAEVERLLTTGDAAEKLPWIHLSDRPPRYSGIERDGTD